MRDNIKFWCALKPVSQLDFEGRTHTKLVPVGEQHIVYQEVLLCRQSRNKLQGEFFAKTKKTVANRIEGVKLCEKCEQKYKEHPNFQWKKWVVSSNCTV